jgi:SRSO17 transposase
MPVRASGWPVWPGGAGRRACVRGLLAPLATKNGWTLAEAADDATPDGMQRLLNRAVRDADGVQDDVRACGAGHLGSPDGVLVVDETGFLKKGTRSAGVRRQYSGNLYLPKSWTADRDRCREAAVPDCVEFATKTELARSLPALPALDGGMPAA